MSTPSVTYTTRSTHSFYYTWQCSRCGFQNVSRYSKTSVYSYTTKHYKDYSKPKKTNKEKTAGPKPSSSSASKSNVTELDPFTYYPSLCGEFGNDSVLLDYRLDGKCKRCGQIELWAADPLSNSDKLCNAIDSIVESLPRFIGIIIIFVIILVFGLISTVGEAIEKGDTKYVEKTALIVGGSIALIAILFFVIRNLYYKAEEKIKQEKERKLMLLDALPGLNYPVIINNGKPIFTPQELSSFKRSYKSGESGISASTYAYIHNSLKDLGIDLDLFSESDDEESDYSESVEDNVKSYVSNESVPQARCFCRKCGKSIPVDSQFCQYCGEKVVRC